MKTDEKNRGQAPDADTGNASNPSPHEQPRPRTTEQLTDPAADKYIRESANIEDMPDPEEEKEAGR